MRAFGSHFTLGRTAALAAPLALLVAMAPATALGQYHQQQRPQNLFEALFPHLMQQRIERQRLRRPPVEVVKVSAPKYYTYRADKLVRIDLSAIAQDTDAARAPSVRVENAALVDAPLAEEAEQTEDTPISQPDIAETNFDVIAKRFEALSVMAEPELAKVIVDHYGENRRTLWLDENLAPNAKARAVLRVFASAGEYGLETSDYDVGLAEPGAGTTSREEAAARFEIAMTARALRYGIDAAIGRVDPNKLSGYHDFKRDDEAVAKALDAIAGEALPARAMLAMHPSSRQFEALRAQLAELRGLTVEQIVIPAGTLIRPGEAHEQVPNVLKAIVQRGSADLSARAGALLARPEPPAAFDEDVVAVVKAFQTENQLTADGIVGPATIKRLTGVSAATKRERIELALERLRWHPHDLGSRHVFINQPAYRARYVQGGKTRLDMRAIVGKKSNQTYFFHDVIETVEYNPYWGIPRSILVNKYLGKLRENPAYFDERGYEVTDRSGRRIASSSIDWYRVGSDIPYDVRQRPGRANALGELKIMFPNAHAIYMHDTPERNLFGRDARAFSHGCVRLQQPREMAAAVLGKSVSYIEGQIAQGQNLTEQVGGNIPVYVAYFTAWPNDDGEVEFHSDIYGRDAHLAKALAAVRAARGAAI